MKSILAFLILSIVHTAVLGVQNKCHVCHDRSSDNCKGEEILCPEGSACMTVSEEVSLFGNKLHSVLKRCARNLPCNTFYRSYASSETYILLYSECCKGDLCNSGGFNMPFDNTEHLGPQCPTCLELNTLEGCKADTTTICPGADDKCLKNAGTLLMPDGTKTDFSTQACISSDLSHTDFTNFAGVVILHHNQKTYDPLSTLL